jgi:hypothetical protein
MKWFYLAQWTSVSFYIVTFIWQKFYLRIKHIWHITNILCLNSSYLKTIENVFRFLLIAVQKVTRFLGSLFWLFQTMSHNEKKDKTDYVYQVNVKWCSLLQQVDSLDGFYLFLFLFFNFFFYSYVHTMFGSFLPPSPTPSLTFPTPSLSPLTPSLPGRNYFALISNFVEERV